MTFYNLQWLMPMRFFLNSFFRLLDFRRRYKANTILTLIVMLLASFYSKAQFYNLPGDYNFSLLTERKLAQRDSSIHTGIKPYIHFFSNKYVHEADSHVIFKYITEDPALDVAFYKHLISVEPKDNKFKLRLDPILNFQIGKDLADPKGTRLSTNTRGVIVSAYIGKDFYCESMFVENQSFFPNYLGNYVMQSQVVPGQGRYKVFKETGYDYAFSSGFVSYQPNKHLNIQAGHGKQKIGNGYRSLLLSDNALNYPYLRFTQQWFKGRLQYTNIYAVLMNLDSAAKKISPDAERLYQKKPAAFQYLSLNVTKSINVSLFQGIVWQAGNSVNKQQVNLMYANPLIFSQAAVYGLNNPNNVVVGADIKIKLANNLNAYAQLMADDLSNSISLGNGYGYQFGLNYFNALNIKNLFLQAEYNNVSQASYISPLSATTDQSYSHYNQSLAFTPGTGSELVLIADYKKKRFFGNFRYQNQTVQQNKMNYYNTNLVNATVGYLINPAYNLNISMGYVYRYQKFYNFNPSNTASYLYIGIKTNLYNAYYDF